MVEFLKRLVPILLSLLYASFMLNGLVQAAESGLQVSGTFEIKIPGVDQGANAYHSVVYLEPLVDQQFETPDAAEIITQNSAEFTPSFLVVSVGQQVNMPNNDDILHNVFSYTKGNQFDLGLYKSGEEKSVVFKTPGLVRIYCSIHRTMKGSIFVAPTPLWSEVKNGKWSIQGVPPGQYRLIGQSQGLPQVVQTLDILEHLDGLALRLAPGS